MNDNSKNEKGLHNSLIDLDLNNYFNFNNKNFSIENIENKNNNNSIEIISDKFKKTNLLNLEKKISMKFNRKYIIKYNTKYIYNELIMFTLLFNKNTHLVSVFKDYMIYDYIDEYLKRFYNKIEIFERLPKFAMFYKNYLAFFCQPCFSNFIYNNLIQKNREKKAEIFYNKNFRDNKESGDEEGIIEDTDDDEDEKMLEKSNIEKTIFNETVKKKIEQYSPINNSMALPESETHLKNDESGLLISFENENSLKDILKNLFNKKKKLKNKYGKEISTIKKNNIVQIDEQISKIQSSITNNKNNNSKNKNSIYKKNIINKDTKIGTLKNIKKTENGQNNNNNYLKKNKLNFKYLTNEKAILSSKNILNNKNNIRTYNEEKERNIYIKKIELTKLNKNRSDSNRSTNDKEKINNNVNIDNIKNKNNNNIINIIKQMKNLGNNKKIRKNTNANSIRKKKNNKINSNDIISISTQFNKNLSEKLIKNKHKIERYIPKRQNNSINTKKHYSNNANFRNNEKIYNINYQSSNNSKFSKIYSYTGLHHKKTISKEIKMSQLSDDLNDLLKTQQKNPAKINNLDIFSPLNRTRENSFSNLNSNFQHYQNLNKSRNHFINQPSSLNNNSTSNKGYINNVTNYNNCVSKYNSSYYSKHHSRHKTFDKNNSINNRHKASSKNNQVNLELKTQKVEVIMNQLKKIKPKIINKKTTQKSTPNNRNKYSKRKKISLVTFENISIHNNATAINTNNNINENNYQKTNINKIYTKLIKKDKFNNNKYIINILSNNKKTDKNKKPHKLKVSASEYQFHYKYLDTNQKSNSINYLNKNIFSVKSNNNSHLIKNKFSSNIINFNSNIPKHNVNEINNKRYKNPRINSLNVSSNQKISCESSRIKGLNYTNLTNNTNYNTNIDINTLINKDEKISKKSLSNFVNNKTAHPNISNCGKNKIKNLKEDIRKSSPMKQIQNVNININNQININNNNQFNGVIPFNNQKIKKINKHSVRNIKQKKGIENQNIIINNKKILLSRNHNSLDFNSLNSFLSANSNYSIRKNYLHKNMNPINLLVKSNNSNIKDRHKTTFYINNFNKDKKLNNNYSYNINNKGKNIHTNIILLDNKTKKCNNEVFKQLKNSIDKICINLKNKKYYNYKININDTEDNNVEKKISDKK